nr:DNA-directed RNA polymerase II subunit RPB7 [Tanacetum cinerariifolium]
MFLHIVLERNMQLHPHHFGRELREKLVSILMKDVEGTCNGRDGFVVTITGIEDTWKWSIRDGTGFVTFPVKYSCVVFLPFKGEILEATVTMVNKMGFFAEARPVQIFVSNRALWYWPWLSRGSLPAIESSKKAFATAELLKSAAAYTELLVWL